MNRVLFILTVIMVAGLNTVSAQIFEEFKLREDLSFSGETTVDIFSELPENRNVSRAALYVSFDFGERIVPTSSLPTDDDVIHISFSLAAYKDGVAMEDFFGSAEHSLTISSNRPEAFFIRDFPVSLDAMVSPDNFPNEIKVIVHDNNIDNFPSVSNIVRFGLNYEERYGVDCNEFSIDFIETLNENPLLNEIVFKWNMNQDFPGSYFQLQVLRLFNEAPEYADNDSRVAAEVNWDDAGTYILKNPSEDDAGRYNQMFTITEGTGFYLWRIRPVSNFFKGGLANPLNYGEWSSAPAPLEGETVDYSLDDAGSWPNACFYFVDMQAERNYSYSRVFTEHGNNKELVTYANRLNQVRQKSTYLPSEDVSVVTQTVLDNTGRPALVTLPVPVDGKNLGYRTDFVTTPGGELYSAKHFDQEDNFQSPSPVSATGDFKYYENNTEDPVASAEGYPFTRTIFYNDGSGRVKEQSGVGKTHRIHNGPENLKRTTRHLYEAATATELEALFGDEAPDYESVYKKIIIDPNQVASVSFVNKDGQIIATGLSYSSEFQPSALEELDGGGGVSTPVRNEITQNTKTGEGFVSSKRIYVPHAQPLSLDYRVQVYELEQLCISQEFDCNYELSVSVTRILDDNSMEDVEVDQSDLELSESVIDGTSYMVASTIVDLPAAGTYVIEKKLIPQGLEMSVFANTSVINGQVMPLVTFFTDLLNDVKTREELDDFFVILKEVSQYLNSGEFSSLRTVPPYNMISGAWWNIYEDEKYTDLFSLGLSYLDDEQENISAMQLSTPCCQNMDIPVNWEPPFDCSLTDRNNDGDIDLLDVPDFEGYMIDVLYDAIIYRYSDREYSTEADMIAAFYEDFLSGWGVAYGTTPVVSFTQDGTPKIEQLPGVVNEMVYHMLTDVYPGSFNEEHKVQYDCEEIFECWSAVVAQLHLLIAPGSDFDYSLGMQEGGSVSTAYIDEHKGNEDIYEKGHDKHFNTGLKGGWFFTRWLAKRKVSKKMRRLRVDPNVNPDDEGARDQMPPFHLVKAFLDCAGYKFAKILTPFDAVPMSYDEYRDSEFAYTGQNFDNPPVPIAFNYAPDDYLSSVEFTKEDRSKFFMPIENWGPMDVANPGHPNPETDKPLFPNVRNPFYAFKYFYYDMMGDPDFQVLESSVCFVDPNDCYEVEMIDGEEFYKTNVDVNGVTTRVTTPCCIDSLGDQSFCYEDSDYYGPGQSKQVVREFAGVGRVKCPYTYENWSSAQRLSFFQMIADYRLPDPDDLNFDDEQNSPVILNDFVETNTWYYNTYQSDNNDADPYLPGDEWELSEFRNEFNQIIPHGDINLGDNQFIFVEKEMHDAELQCLSECEKKRDEFRRKLYDMLLERCYTIGGCRTNDPSTWDVVPEDDIEMMINAMVLHCSEQCDMNTFSVEQINTRRLETPLVEVGPNGYEYKFQYGMGGMPNAGAAGYADDNSVIAQPFTGARDNIRYLFDYKNQPYNFNLSWYQYTAHKQVMEWDFEITLPGKCEDLANEEADYPSAQADDHFLPRDNYELNPNMIPDTDSPALNDPVVSPSVLLQRSGGPGFDENGEPEE
ncbi:hypothetical protein [Marinilabilia sp.]|uniref:hypothetical protein n=1 Tax=Marinilabilia sp. TaxID=2021252 RepID=UPI0025C26424|nr:hypothetical protein [Marinilabilia sp.]